MKKTNIKTEYQKKKNIFSDIFAFDTKHSSSGFVALFTILIASTLMIMIVGIFSSTYKEFLLTKGATDSDKSFFSADTGIECALFYDRKMGAFPDFAMGVPLSSLTCRDIDSDIDDLGDFKYSFMIDGSNWCSLVRVDKSYEEEGVFYTKIESFGYNVSCEERDSSPVSVERALMVKYPNAFFVL